MGNEQKYKIVDWAYNRMFSNKTFECIDSAFDFISCRFDDDELEDIYIVPMRTRCHLNGYWSTSN
tara:strand:+ start:15 stop:209 length:195 start_codon:yes stop_codon:yes gene_type:complete